MADARKGRLDAFGVLVQRHQESLLNFFRRLGVYTDAEDLVQETLLRVFRYRKTYRPKAKFRTFLYRVARTVWIDWVRRKARREEFMTECEHDPAFTAPPPVLDAAALDVQTALNTLSDKLRVVVVMRIYQGLQYSEIAEALDIPEGTAKSRMSLALAQLRKFMYGEVEQQRASP
jgi:RNA polymerase sigma-70 factor (ECF subfamily)